MGMLKRLVAAVEQMGHRPLYMHPTVLCQTYSVAGVWLGAQLCMKYQASLIY
jgi:hypothetical protein